MFFRATFLIENGISQKVEECMAFNTFINTRKSVTIFRTIEEFIRDKVGFDDLVLSNFKSLFVAYFSFLVLIFIVWVIATLIAKYRRPRPRFRTRRTRFRSRVHVVQIGK